MLDRLFRLFGLREEKETPPLDINNKNLWFVDVLVQGKHQYYTIPVTAGNKEVDALSAANAAMYLHLGGGYNILSVEPYSPPSDVVNWGKATVSGPESIYSHT